MSISWISVLGLSGGRPSSQGKAMSLVVYIILILFVIRPCLGQEMGDDEERQKAEIELNMDVEEAINNPNQKSKKDNDNKQDEKKSKDDRGFTHGFVASLSIIILSELGDKTFFIAAIMAMKYSRLSVFGGAIFALAVMTVLSAFVGYAAVLIPRKYTYYLSTLLFVIFGLKLLKEGYYMSADEGQEELEEVSAELKKREENMNIEVNSASTVDVESGAIRGTGSRLLRYCHVLVSPIFIQAFVLTFLAEWGDRSQIMTIVLAARENIAGVTLGGILGHMLCTQLAVVGGRMLAQKISIRTVTLIGGVVFLLFAATAFFQDPSKI